MVYDQLSNSPIANFTKTNKDKEMQRDTRLFLLHFYFKTIDNFKKNIVNISKYKHIENGVLKITYFEVEWLHKIANFI